MRRYKGTCACCPGSSWQGLKLVHLPAQRERFLWDKGCAWGVYMVFMAAVEGFFKGLGMLCVSDTAQVELRSGRV